MFSVGLTGGIGSGKSTVAAEFAKRGVSIVDLDLIARQIVAPGLPAHREVVEAFGPQIVERGGRLNRAKLRHEVFSDSAKKTVLENILHPRIYRQMQQSLKQVVSAYGMVVIPLLAESSRAYPLDRVLVVDAAQSDQLLRVTKRDDQTAEEVQRIIEAQAVRGDRLAIADDVIQNSGTLEELAEKIDAMHRLYLELAQQKSCERG